jgi:hypothetical protein
MNFFGGNSNNGPTPLTIAKMEAEVLTDLFNRYFDSKKENN